MAEDRSVADREPRGAAISIRPLENTVELNACVEAQRTIWGVDFADVAPASLMQISQKVGGLAAGAFDDEASELIGFVWGLTGVCNGRLSHWSHMLGVLPEHRGRGIGQRLKRFQQEYVARQGVQEIRWSFDPLMAGNAHFNLNLLRVEIDSYEPEMYGETGSSLHSFGTDRFVARWELESDGACSRARAADRQAIEIHKLPLANTLPREDGRERHPFEDSASRRIRIEIPSSILKIHSEDPELAMEWRQSTRAAFRRCMAVGYRVAGFVRLPAKDRCAYVLERDYGAGMRDHG